MVSLQTVSGRTICALCGGWAEISSVAGEFAALHDHPASAPVIYKFAGDPADWSVPGLLAAAPLAGQVVAFVGGKTIREAKRVVAKSPDALKSMI